MPAARAIKKKTATRKGRKARKPLLSHSSILILSGFLIGMVFNQMTESGVEIYVFAAGLVGLLGYLCLDELAQRRRLQAEKTEFEQATNKLERRLNRHILQGPQVRSSRPSPVHHDLERQYQTVVNSYRY